MITAQAEIYPYSAFDLSTVHPSQRCTSKLFLVESGPPLRHIPDHFAGGLLLHSLHIFMSKNLNIQNKQPPHMHAQELDKRMNTAKKMRWKSIFAHLSTSPLPFRCHLFFLGSNNFFVMFTSSKIAKAAINYSGSFLIQETFGQFHSLIDCNWR